MQVDQKTPDLRKTRLGKILFLGMQVRQLVAFAVLKNIHRRSGDDTEWNVRVS